MKMLPGRPQLGNSLKLALTKAAAVARAERQLAEATARRISGLPAQARRWPLADPDPGPPPRMPDPTEVMAEARRKAARVGTVTAGVATWREASTLYRRYRQGEALGADDLWRSTVRIGQRTMAASQGASRRHLSIVGLDALVRVVAWQSARRAGRSVIWRAIHATSRRLVGRVGVVLMAVDVFKSMHSDMSRYREGRLEQDDLYRNMALTGVSVVAPLVGASAGPLGATVGLAVSIGASMARR